MKRVFERFRECDEEYILLKKEQYMDVAEKILEVVQNSGFPEGEGAFVLAKKWLKNNEMMSVPRMISEVSRTLLNDFSRFVSMLTSFILGALTTYYTSRAEFTIITIPWGLLLLIALLSFIFEIGLKYATEKIEKLHIRILDEMTFHEYELLIKQRKESIEGQCIQGGSENKECDNKMGEVPETYKQIEKKIHKLSKQKVDFYQKMIGCLQCYSVEMLDYLEVQAKLEYESCRRSYGINVVPMSISIVALFVSALPEVTTNQIYFLSRMGLALSIAAVAYFTIYFIHEHTTSKYIERHERMLLLIEKCKRKNI